MKRRVGLSIAIVAGLLGGVGEARAQLPYFAKKTITIYIGFTAGGSYDLYGRLVARHLGEHLPGKPAVIASNMAGGGGMIAINYLYDAATKDGTALGMVVETISAEQVLENPGVKYDAAKLTWIGRVAESNNIRFMWQTSKVQSIEDAKKTEATVAGTGPGNIAEMVPRLLNAVIGTKFKIISGYPASNEGMIAMERGEVDGAESSWAAVKVGKQDWLKDKKIKIILQDVLERSPEMPDVPTLTELGDTAEQKQLLSIYAGNGVIGRSILAPPGLAPDLTKALRDGFDAMVADPAFVAEVQKLQIDYQPMKGAELEASAKKLLDMPAAVRQKAKVIFGR
jgi:tripartite-type tricarboxylate transporter receptor subunit TctC